MNEPEAPTKHRWTRGYMGRLREDMEDYQEDLLIRSPRRLQRTAHARDVRARSIITGPVIGPTKKKSSSAHPSHQEVRSSDVNLPLGVRGGTEFQHASLTRRGFMAVC